MARNHRDRHGLTDHDRLVIARANSATHDGTSAKVRLDACRYFGVDRPHEWVDGECRYCHFALSRLAAMKAE